jgi:glucose-1-phosphate thymidylyltransferase
MRGIVLAGGTGSRLWPITWGVSKQLIPIYDKPLVHYPIATLMLSGIREILIISTPQDLGSFQRLLGPGERYGVNFHFAVQEKPRGLADAFIIGEEFIGTSKVSLILGDNIFYGSGLGSQLTQLRNVEGAHIFAYKVKDPHQYGVIEFDSMGKVISLEEKPMNPRSTYAVPGLYFYDNQVIEIARQITPSSRGEIEITSINQVYLEQGMLNTTTLERGTAWLDTGTFESLNAASDFIKVIEERQGQKISCLEEIAWRNNWISDSDLIARANDYKSSPFSDYLRGLID